MQKTEKGKQSKSSKLNQTQVLLEWQAPVRLFKKRGREYFSTIAAIVFLLTVTLFIFRELLLIGVVWTFALFVCVLALVKPGKIRNQITKKGIRIGGNFYRWEGLTDFWLEEKHGYFIFNILMPFQVPGRIMLLAKEEEQEKIMEILLDKLVYHQKSQKAFIDKAADWLTNKFQF